MANLSKEDVINQLKSEKPVDYYGDSVTRKVYLQASGITLIVLLAIFFIELIATRKFDLLIWGIGFTFIGSGLFLEGKNFKKTGKLVFGAILLLAAIIAIAGSFIMK